MKKKWWKIVEKKERKKSVKNEKQNVFGETCKVRLLIFVSFRQVPWNLPTVKTIVLSFTIVIDLRRNISNEISIFDLLASFFFSHFFRNFFFFFLRGRDGRWRDFFVFSSFLGRFWGEHLRCGREAPRQATN